MAKQQQTPQQIAAAYERELKRRQQRLIDQIDQLLNDVVNAVVPYAAIQSMPDGVFDLSKLPALNRKIDSVISQLNKSIEGVVTSGINGMWELSNIKNNLIADIRIDRNLLPADAVVKFYDPNVDALAAFKERQIDGLNLSGRVYNSTVQLKAELEAGLAVGISKGQSAAEMGRDLRQYLKDPDKLFRRVRDEEGNLQLSKNAKAFHPGQGVYRSSRANIERLTRTETNMAYRKADSERYKQQSFVLGFEIRLSNSHVQCDMCDSMAGEYPSSFVFIGWHPHCLCYTVPILMSKNQFIEYRKLVQAGTATPENIAKIATHIQGIPDTANEWMNNNIDKIGKLKQMPYWYRDNPDFVPEIPQPTK